MKVGYVRTSTGAQNIDRQVDELSQCCDKVVVENGVSARKKIRPEYLNLVEDLKDGDTLVVVSFDRVYRSVVEGLSSLDALTDKGVALQSLSQKLDLTTPDGRLFFTLTIAIAEWEVNILSWRTLQGLKAATKRGTRLGRPKKLSDEQIAEARCALEADFYSSLTELAESFRVHERTLTRALDIKS